MTRYVYILIAHENDNYAAMCAISALSVRGVDAGARITVLSDGRTLTMLRHCDHQLLEVADEVVDCLLDEPPKLASRMLKTTLLQRLESDFIFLDVDTVLVRPIARRLRLPYSLQMALDRNSSSPAPGFPNWIVKYYQQMDWKWPTRHYYNSGVMLVRADEPARLLFAEWHRRWQAFTATGRHLDQPALNSAIDTLGTPVGLLPISYNAMVRVDEAYRWGARVLHFFAEGSSLDEGTEYARLVALVASGQRLTSQDIKTGIRRRWPLVEPWKWRRHLKAGSVRGAWHYFQRRSDASIQNSRPGSPSTSQAADRAADRAADQAPD